MSRRRCEVWQGPGMELRRCTAARLLDELADGSVDAVVTDPPYSSGGAFRSDRAQRTGAKYVMTGTKRLLPDFDGDNRDQWTFLLWSALWMEEALRVTRKGGVFLCFTDWRQLPLTVMAVQMAGWVYRGLVPWDKTEATRPQRGWFRAQAEYVVAATNGPLGDGCDEYLPGVFRHGVDAAKKRHQTGKPLGLMRDLLRVVKPGGLVVDPFAGSGMTLVAAAETGRRGLGSEKAAAVYEVAVREVLVPAAQRLEGGGGR